ncbi:queuosine precursor transporter [Paenirhodobacter populi]|uniref:Probable queuosine precursor transporter n=1 Tax=Paenirhodobacter populi TaxID=2306993 RepID=A0A443JSX9_9RHOB|nr:queuosine precursor transporter [Sinirhodobacter populi]RWR23586.1 VUT family protein [Sinirhodobacter populi]
MQRLMPGIIAMTIVVVVSNILVQHLLGQWLTWGAFTYPLAFLVTDLTNRLAGAVAARKVVVIGFIVGIACSVIGSQIEGEFGALVSFRVAVASGLAFLCAQLTDVSVFNLLRRYSWWKAPLFASFIGSCLDTAIFFTIAFSAALSFIEPSNDVAWANEVLPLLGVGPAVPLWVSLAVADWCVKVAIAVIALTPYRAIVWRKAPRLA